MERLYLQQVKPRRIADALGLTLEETNARLLKVEDDLANSVQVSSYHRIMTLFGSLIARSQVRYNMLALLHDSGVDQLGAIKAMKEEDRYVADMLIRPIEIARQMNLGDGRKVHVLPTGDEEEDLFDGMGPDEDEIEDEVMNYDVIEKATKLGRG